MAMQSASGRNRQQGIVMIIAVIMLLAVTLMVVSASNIVQANLKVVQNTESREQVRLAALAAIEEAISDRQFVTKPDDIFDTGRACDLGNGHSNNLCYDLNGDGETDITVAIEPPECTVVLPTPNADLDLFGSTAQASCYLPALAGQPVEYSMCGYSVWDFVANAEDVVTGAAIQVRQGVSILIALNDAETECP